MDDADAPIEEARLPAEPHPESHSQREVSDRDPEILTLLLKAYELDRHDDVQLLTSLYAQLAASFALLSVVAYILATPNGRPYWMITLVPVLPLPAVAFGATHVVETVMRGILLDAEEVRLRSFGLALDIPYLTANFSTEDDGAETPTLRVPSSHSVRSDVWRGRVGAVTLGITGIAFLGAYGVLLVYSFGHEYARHPWLAFSVLFICLIGILVLVGVAIVGIWPRSWLIGELVRLKRSDEAFHQAVRHREDRKSLE